MYLKTAKKNMNQAEKTLKHAERNYGASLKHGSDKQQTMCYDSMVNHRGAFEKARSEYHRLRREQESLKKDRVKNSSMTKKVAIGIGIVVTGIVAVVAGISIFGNSNDENNTSTTDPI